MRNLLRIVLISIAVTLLVQTSAWIVLDSKSSLYADASSWYFQYVRAHQDQVSGAKYNVRFPMTPASVSEMGPNAFLAVKDAAKTHGFIVETNDSPDLEGHFGISRTLNTPVLARVEVGSYSPGCSQVATFYYVSVFGVWMRVPAPWQERIGSACESFRFWLT